MKKPSLKKMIKKIIKYREEILEHGDWSYNFHDYTLMLSNDGNHPNLFNICLYPAPDNSTDFSITEWTHEIILV